MSASLEDLLPGRAGPIQTYRLVASAHPAISLFGDLEDLSPEDWDLAYALEAMTNPRLRDERGELVLIPQAERVYGPGSSLIMAAFAYRNPRGSRFSDGSFGVYYCAELEETAIREVAYHMGKFFGATQEAPQTFVARNIGAELEGSAYNVFALNDPWLRDDDYSACQAFARQARVQVDCLRYQSVRHPGQVAYAVFRPKALRNARHIRYVELYWDGNRFTHAANISLEL